MDTLLQASEILADMHNCVDAFDEVFETRALDPVDFSINLSECLTNRQNAAALVEIAALFGVQTTIGFHRAIRYRQNLDRRNRADKLRIRGIDTKNFGGCLVRLQALPEK